MDGQMSLFDFLKEDSLEDLEESEMIRRLSEATGLKFIKKEMGKWADECYTYEAKRGKGIFTANYSRYSIDNHERFISIGCDVGTSGSGSPCDSLDEAIKCLRKKILWATEMEQRMVAERKRRAG